MGKRYMSLALRFSHEEHQMISELKDKLGLTWEEFILFLVDDFNNKDKKEAQND